jgi:hypothetical protein
MTVAFVTEYRLIRAGAETDTSIWVGKEIKEVRVFLSSGIQNVVLVSPCLMPLLR